MPGWRGLTLRGCPPKSAVPFEKPCWKFRSSSAGHVDRRDHADSRLASGTSIVVWGTWWTLLVHHHGMRALPKAIDLAAGSMERPLNPEG